MFYRKLREEAGWYLMVLSSQIGHIMHAIEVSNMLFRAGDKHITTQPYKLHTLPLPTVQ